MKPSRVGTSLGMVALTFALASSGASSRAGSVQVGREVAAGLARASRIRVIVTFSEPRYSVFDRAEAQLLREREIAQTRGDVLRGLEPSDFELTHEWATVSGMAGWLTASGLERLLDDPDVRQIDVDPIAYAHMAEAVPMVHADEVQAMGFTGRGVTVAVLDTGIDSDHADFAGRIVDQACFCTNAAGAGCCPGGATTGSGAGSAEDDNGHGTNVTGVIAGGGSVGPRGMAPDASIVALKVLASDGSGGSASIVSGLEYVLKNRPEVKVVNVSLGLANLFPAACDASASFTTGFATVINSLKARGTSVFASSGNNGQSAAIAVPACITNAIGVGAVYDGDVGTVTFGCTDATTAQDRVACFSNSSSLVDLLAPGATITSSGNGGGAVTFLGTSQACPAAAGAGALLYSANPAASVDKIESALKNTGVAITDTRNGLSFRRINVRAALDAAR